MNRIEANRLFIEIFTCLIEGEEDRAKELAQELDGAALTLFRLRAQEAAILAEREFFEEARKRRGEA